MSHFSRIKTKISDQNFLLAALRKIGFQPEEGQGYVRGYGGMRSKVDVWIRIKTGYDIGFKKDGRNYVCIADWFGVEGIKRQPFLDKLTQCYAGLAVKEQLAAQGFAVAEEKQVEGRVHLLLRRLG
jgi:hypothetical protein